MWTDFTGSNLKSSFIVCVCESFPHIDLLSEMKKKQKHVLKFQFLLSLTFDFGRQGREESGASGRKQTTQEHSSEANQNLQMKTKSTLEEHVTIVSGRVYQ